MSEFTEKISEALFETGLLDHQEDADALAEAAEPVLQRAVALALRGFQARMQMDLDEAARQAMEKAWDEGHGAGPEASNPYRRREEE